MVFALALALPAAGMVIARFLIERLAMVCVGVALFATIVGLYFVAADIVFSLSEETRTR